MIKLNSFFKGVIVGLGAVGAFVAINTSGILAYRHRIRKACKPFYSAATKRFVIPGLKKGFDPQDLFYVKSADIWLFSGYSTKHKSTDVSPIYKVNSEGKAEKITVELPNGVTYKGHGAAVCATDEYVFLTVKDGYVVLTMESLLNAKDKDTIRAIAHVPVELEPAFMNIQEGILYIGEFYHKRFYPTPQSHWRKCPDGSTNPALMYAYDPSDEADALFGFSPRPSRVYSIPSEIQGMCVMPENRIVLSQSWGYGDSTLLVYEADSAVKSDAKLKKSKSYLVAGEKVPLYFLYDGSLEKSVELPPMSEGIDAYDGEVWLANESASDLYVLGKFYDGKYVYSLPV